MKIKAGRKISSQGEKPKGAEPRPIKAVAETGADAKVENVTKFLEIGKCGAFGTPAAVFEGQIKSIRKIVAGDEIKKWIVT